MSESYIPLYRKYRPQSFADLVGQEAIVKTLTNAINLNKIAHAYLFTGPRGTGKTSSARIFAMSLNCQNGPTASPCGKCPSCLDIKNGSSLDVIEIDAASNRKVEDARDILEKVQFVAVSGKYKIYIIDEVHMLTKEAFNTLLKTLEEPPQNLVFILATTESHKVLDTIVSRCQRFDFRRITLKDIISRLKYVSEQEHIDISDDAISLIASASSGGMRDALALLDQASVLGIDGKKIEAQDILSLIGKISNDNMFEIVDIIAQKQTDKLAMTLQKLIQAGNEPLVVVRELVNYFRNLLIARTCENSDGISALINTTQDFLDQLAKQSKSFETIEIVQIIEKLSEYERNLKNVSNQYLWLELSLISLCYRNDIKILSDLERRVSELENIVKSGAVPAPARPQIEPIRPVETSHTRATAPISSPEPPVLPKHETRIPPQPSQHQPVQPIVEQEPQVIQENTEASVPSVPAAATNDTAQNWVNLLSRIDSVPSRSFFNGLSKPVEVNADRIIITFAIEAFVKQAQDKSKIHPLEVAAQKLFGKLPKISVRTPLPEDKDVRTKGIKAQLPPKATANPDPQPEEEPMREDELKQTLDSAKEDTNAQSAYADSDLPEQVKNFANIFQGKIMD